MDMVYGCMYAYIHMYYANICMYCVYMYMYVYKYTYLHQNGIILTYCFLTYFLNLIFYYYYFLWHQISSYNIILS